MNCDIRLSQLYELQRVALINVHYYASRTTRLTKTNRWLQIAAALTASGTIASVVRDVPDPWKWISVPASVIAALTTSLSAVLNYSDSIARAERLHSAYKMLYHSAEVLAKQTIGAVKLTPEQECVACMLESQLAALGPQDEIDPNEKMMAEAQMRAEKQLPDSYYYPTHGH